MMAIDKNGIRVVIGLMIFLFSLSGARSSWAQINTTFNAAVDNVWTNSLNWTNGVPGSLDNATIDGGNVTISTTGTVVVGTLTVQNSSFLFLSGTGGANTFTVNGTTNVKSGSQMIITTVHNSFVGNVTIELGTNLQINGAGRLNASNGVIIEGTVNNLAGDINFGTLTIDGSISLSGSASGVDFNGGSIILNSGGVIDFNNRPSTTVTFTGDFVDINGSSLGGTRDVTNTTFFANGGGPLQNLFCGGVNSVTQFYRVVVNALSNLQVQNYGKINNGLTINTGATFSLLLGNDASLDVTAVTPANFTNTGTFAINDGTVSFGSLSPSAGAITVLSSGSFTGTSLALSSTATVTATGSASISLNSFANNGSTSSFVPGGSTVTFTGASPSISGSSGSTFNNIVINSGASFSSTNNLTVNGSFTNNGNAISFASNTISFAGSGTLDGGSNGTSFNNMTVTTTGSVAIARKVDLTGVLTLLGSGLFDADGSGSGVFTVKSTSQTAGGQIANLPNPGNFSGNLIIERYLHSGGASGDYRFLSVPINTTVTPINLGLWKSAIGVTGNFSDPSGYAATDGAGNFAAIQQSNNTNPSVSTYNGTAYSFIASAGNPVSSVALSGTTGYVAYNYASSPVTISYSGEIQKDLVSIPISSTNNNFNLIPNPYPATIDWDNILGAGLKSAMYLRNTGPVITTYVRGGSITNPPLGSWQGEIAVGQCFWAQSDGSLSSLSLNESAKNTASANSIFVRDGATKSSAVRVQLMSKTQRDEAIIQFVENSTDEKDDKFDASKFKNGILISPIGRNNYLNVSSYITDSSSDLAINSIAPLAADLASKTVGLKISDVANGDYTLNISPENFALGYSIVLTDKFLNKQMELKTSISYSFSVTDNPQSSGDKRFILEFVQSITAVLDEPESGFQIYPNPVVKDRLTVVTPALLAGKVKSISILDLSGRALAVEDQLDSSEVTFDVSGYNSSVYVVSIKLSNGISKSYRIIKR